MVSRWGRSCYFPEHLRGGGLVEADPIVPAAHDADRLEHAKDPGPADIGGELGLAEGQLDEADRSQVVDLVGLYLFDRGDERAKIGEITVEQLDLGDLVLDDHGLRVVLASDHSVDLVSLADEQLSQVTAILAGDPGDEGAGHRSSLGLSLRLPRSDVDGPSRLGGGQRRRGLEQVAKTGAGPSITQLQRVRGAPQDGRCFCVAVSLPGH